MDSFQLWKDEYRRQVEDVLAERRRAREKGERPETAPGESFSGRLADLVIPPAGVYAEAAALRSRLAEVEALNAGLLRRVEEAEAASGRERDRRERIKDAAARLAVELRGLQAEVAAARERAGIDEARVREARMDADHAHARAEYAERALIAARRLEAEIPARLAAAIGDELAAAELARADAASARAKAAAMEKEASKRREEAERAEHELEGARRAGAEAAEGAREAVAALSEYRARVKAVAARLKAHVRRELVRAESAASESRRRESEALARAEAQAGRQAAMLEEERARLNAELEDERGRLEAAHDADRAALQERWREQAELLEKLRQARGRSPEA
jgi:colicin import membrane protein